MNQIHGDLKQFKNPILCTVGIVLFSMFISYLLGIAIDGIYGLKPNIGIYIFNIYFSDITMYLLLFLIFLGIMLIIEKRRKERTYAEITYTEIYKEKGFRSKIILFSFIGWLFFEALTNPVGVVVDYKKIDKLSFGYSIVKDISENNTTTVKVPSKQIKAENYTETEFSKMIVSAFLDQSSKSSKNFDSTYVNRVLYIQDDKDSKEYKYSSVECKIINRIVEELKEYEKEIIIEFYSNTGVIKKIDGIEKKDTDKLEERIRALKEEYKNKKALYR